MSGVLFWGFFFGAVQNAHELMLHDLLLTNSITIAYHLQFLVKDRSSTVDVLIKVITLQSLAHVLFQILKNYSYIFHVLFM